MSSEKVDVLYEAKAPLAEGPFYDEANGELIWVDIELGTINFLRLSDGSNRVLEMGDTVGAAIPYASNDKLLGMVGRNICEVDRISGDCTVLEKVDSNKPNNRFNDSKCDPSGRLWAGTMALEKSPGTGELIWKQGTLFRYDGKTVVPCVSEITISNGMDWSIDRTKMYYIDSIPKKVYAFDYDEATGAISNQKIIIDFSVDPSLGFPDGMSIDKEGKLWIASFNGGCVTRWDPDTGEKLAHIKIPAKRVTSCCFGGENYDVMYVTTARFGAPQDELDEYPFAGSIFVINNLGVAGFPPNRFTKL